jgi:transketolase N-terminal domain/subunit
MSYIEHRILKLSKKHNLSHIGSCLMASGPIEAMHLTKKHNEPMILSSGHAGLALYCVLEAWGYGDAEELFLKHGVHPNRDVDHGIWASTGSLGHGIGLAVGMALADRERLVYVLMTDGECAEGSVWESLRIAQEQGLKNIRLAVVCNGYGAYGPINVELLEQRLATFYPCVVIKTNLFNYPDWLQGQQAHYVTMTDKQYDELWVKEKK